jgi:hypothetical protein
MSMIKKNLDLIIVGFVALCVVMYDVTIDFLFAASYDHMVFWASTCEVVFAYSISNIAVKL